MNVQNKSRIFTSISIICIRNVVSKAQHLMYCKNILRDFATRPSKNYQSLSLKKSLKKKGRETEFKQKVNIASSDKFSSWTWTWTCPWNDCPWTYLQMNFSMLVKILTDRLVLFIVSYGLNLTVKIWPRLSDLLKGPVWKGLGDFEISSKCNTGGRFTFSFLIANLPTYFAFGTKNQKVFIENPNVDFFWKDHKFWSNLNTCCKKLNPEACFRKIDIKFNIRTFTAWQKNKNSLIVMQVTQPWLYTTRPGQFFSIPDALSDNIWPKLCLVFLLCRKAIGVESRST